MATTSVDPRVIGRLVDVTATLTRVIVRLRRRDDAARAEIEKHARRRRRIRSETSHRSGRPTLHHRRTRACSVARFCRRRRGNLGCRPNTPTGMCFHDADPVMKLRAARSARNAECPEEDSSGHSALRISARSCRGSTRTPNRRSQPRIPQFRPEAGTVRPPSRWRRSLRNQPGESATRTTG